MMTSTPALVRYLFVMLAVPACIGMAVAQESRVEELELAIKALQKKNSILSQQLLNAAERESTPLDEALAAANLDAEKYRELYKELVLRVDGLGLDSISSEEGLRARLLKAIGEINTLKEEKLSSEQQLLRLSEVMLKYLKDSSAESRAEIEAELRATDGILGFGEDERVAEADGDMNDARVISFKDELRLAVLNVGKRSGVRVGMPMSIVRKDRIVGSALVVDVRDSICGVLIQEIFTEGDRVQVQDRAQPRTTQGANL